MIYFDQAASTFPKPAEVANAMHDVMVTNGANPGRGGHQLAQMASQTIQETRVNIANMFGCSDPNKCIFHSNATGALNQAIKGMVLTEGDHVITTNYEHNSVRRPLEYLHQERNVKVTYIESSDNESFLSKLKEAIQATTKLIVINHASNITGAIVPLKEICTYAKSAQIPVLVDASQTAGHIPIHMQQDAIDMLAFSGHKGMFGPQGTGVLLVASDIDLQPIIHGGTGTFSKEPTQPNVWPEGMESGTLNTPGIAGLNAAVKKLNESDMANVPRETILINKLIKGLQEIPDIIFYGPKQSTSRLPIASFNVKGIDSQEIAMVLDSHYKIAVRGGLHCSPLTHESLETVNQGVVRVSLSKYNTEEEVEQFLVAMKEIVIAYDQI